MNECLYVRMYVCMYVDNYMYVDDCMYIDNCA